MSNKIYTLKLLSLIISSLSLLTALILESILNLIPCDLCHKQRLIHFVIFSFSVLFLIPIEYKFIQKISGKILMLLWVSSATLSLYHFGIEQGYWMGFSECSANIQFNKNTLKNILEINPIKCDEVEFKFLNLSLAGWNTLSSMLVVISFLYFIFFKKGKIWTIK